MAAKKKIYLIGIGVLIWLVVVSLVRGYKLKQSAEINDDNSRSWLSISWDLFTRKFQW